MASFNIRAVVGATTAPFRRELGRLSAFVKRTFSGIGGVLAGVFSVGLVKGLFDEFDRLAKLARQLRLPASTVQRFSVAAQTGGTNVEAFSKALLQSERNAIKAEQGLVTYQRAFDSLNINTSEFLQLGIEDKLITLADAYVEAQDKGLALASLQEALGRSGRELIPTLEQGGEALRDYLASIETLSDEDFVAIEQVNDQITLLTNNLKVSFLPVLVDVIGFITFLGVRVKQGIQIIKEYGIEAGKAALAVSTLGASTLIDGLSPDFSGATDRLGDRLQESEDFLDEVLRKLNQARTIPQSSPLDLEGIQSALDALDRIRQLGLDFSDDLDRSRAAAQGLAQEMDFLDGKIFEIDKRLRELGPATLDNTNLQEVLRLTEQRINLERELKRLDDQANDRFNTQQEAVQRLANERKILELRAEGRDREADLLERQAQAVEAARQFLESVGVAFEGVNAEAAIREFEQIFELQDQANQRQQQTAQAVTNAFRSIGGNDPIGVALSGPFDKQVEAQKETTAAVEAQTRSLADGLADVTAAIEDNPSTLTFARLS